MGQSLTIEAANRRFGWLMAAPSLATLLPGHSVSRAVGAVHERARLHVACTQFRHFHRHRQFQKRALTDAEFRHSLGLTAFFVVAVVLIEFAIGFLIALDAEQRRALQANLLRNSSLPAADEPGHRRADLADVPSSDTRHRQLSAECPWSSARKLARKHQGRHLDHHSGRHLASGFLHDRPVAGRIIGSTSRAI